MKYPRPSAAGQAALDIAAGRRTKSNQAVRVLFRDGYLEHGAPLSSGAWAARLTEKGRALVDQLRAEGHK